ncbi:Transcription termination/antitermination protein NusG [Methylobacterium oxalidis]|nr:Transcription termination/antitermination protein NusG [Methylobacterium oxalidis]
MRYPPRRIIDQSRRWYVAATWGVGTPYDEAEADRRADEALRDAGLDVWMATYGATVARRGRRVDVNLHFFPGYLFVGLSGESEAAHDRDMQQLRRCKHVAAVLGIDQPLALPPLLVQAIADAFTGDVKSERVQAAALYRIGEMMRVTSGPFATFYAKVTELLHSGHIRADVQIFGRETPVHFEPDQLART